MMKILILAEQRSGALTLASRRLIGAANSLAAHSSLLLSASMAERSSLSQQAGQWGIAELFFWEQGANPFDLMPMAEALNRLGLAFDLLLAAHTSETVALFGLFSARTGWPLWPDLTALDQQPDGTLVVRRPVYEAAASSCVTLRPQGHCLTLRSSHFPVAMDSRVPAVSCQEVALPAQPDGRWQSRALLAQTLPEQRLDEARIVVAGGRPLGKRLQPMLAPLASVMGAAVGATRGAVDAGHAPVRCQIGQTGAHIAPELYLAIGISGAPQHMAGIGRSRCIIAINQDATAPLVQAADYWLQADMLTVVPALTAALRGDAEPEVAGLDEGAGRV